MCWSPGDLNFLQDLDKVDSLDMKEACNLSSFDSKIKDKALEVGR